MHQTIAPKVLYFGTPVILISTCSPEGQENLAPFSSAWALGDSVLLGLATGSQTYANLMATGECVINLPSHELWEAVERIAPYTGMNPVPGYKQAQYRYEMDKFAIGGFTRQPAELVRPPLVQECPLQLEARLLAAHPLQGSLGDGAAALEVQVVRVHAAPQLVADERHVNPTAWQPLIYNFRHYFGLGERLGNNFRAGM